MIYDYIVHLLTLFSSTLGSVAGLSGIRQLGKVPFDLHFAGQVRNYAGSVFGFAPIREQVVGDRGFALACMSQSVPYFEGVLGKQIACCYPPLGQGYNLSIRIFLLALTGSDFDGSDIAIVAVHDEDVIDTIAQYGLNGVVEHSNGGIIASGQRKRKAVIVSAVADGDRRDYHHTVYAIRNLLGKLIGYQSIAALCNMLSMGLAGSDGDNRFCEVSLFYLMRCHFP